MPKVNIVGQVVAIDANQGDLLLDVLKKSDISITYSCQVGNCGMCQCEYISGEVCLLSHSTFALSPQQKREQIVLACRLQIWGDCQIRLLETDPDLIY